MIKYVDFHKKVLYFLMKGSIEILHFHFSGICTQFIPFCNQSFTFLALRSAAVLYRGLCYHDRLKV